LINAFNSKAALFILAFLPQFIDLALGPVWRHIVLSDALLMLTDTVITAGYGLTAEMLGILAVRLVWK
jgi:threonine/homoserine/homoserine lactone efflux protein